MFLIPILSYSLQLLLKEWNQVITFLKHSQAPHTNSLNALIVNFAKKKNTHLINQIVILYFLSDTGT